MVENDDVEEKLDRVKSPAVEVFLYTWTLDPEEFTLTRSNLPSLFKSPTHPTCLTLLQLSEDTEAGVVDVVNLIFLKILCVLFTWWNWFS